MKIDMSRTTKTGDGIYGHLIVDEQYDRPCVENLIHAIPAGIYDVTIDKSPRLGYYTPHIKVPARDQLAPGGDAGIRIHIANYPHELQGCIAPGMELDVSAGMVKRSKMAYNLLLLIIAKIVGVDSEGDFKWALKEPTTIEVTDGVEMFQKKI